MASYLKEEIGKKFDGDYDALWKSVKGKSFPGKGSLRGVIASNLQGWNGVFYSMADVEQVPKLQIALPLGFDEWDGQTPIKVAYTPLTVDDMDAEEIYAYDASGNEHVLDARTPPDSPVMVVEINERTDDEVPLPNANQLCGDCGDGGGGGYDGGSGGSSDPVLKITQVNLDRDAMDYEPWWKGDAELYFLFYEYNELEDLLSAANNNPSGGVLVGMTVGYFAYIVCDILVINDDPIGDKNGFEEIVQTAMNDLGAIYEWTASGTWKIMLKME